MGWLLCSSIGITILLLLLLFYVFFTQISLLYYAMNMDIKIVYLPTHDSPNINGTLIEFHKELKQTCVYIDIDNYWFLSNDRVPIKHFLGQFMLTRGVGIG